MSMSNRSSDAILTSPLMSDTSRTSGSVSLGICQSTGGITNAWVVDTMHKVLLRLTALEDCITLGNSKNTKAKRCNKNTDVFFTGRSAGFNKIFTLRLQTILSVEGSQEFSVQVRFQYARVGSENHRALLLSELPNAVRVCV
jgi:hypothetical protein